MQREMGTKNKRSGRGAKFYVNGVTGADTLDTGRGESAAKPFKTIQAAVEYIASNYNVNKFIASISIASGTYTENVNLPKYTATTGVIELKGDPENRGNVVIQGCIAGAQSVGRWDIQYLTIKNRTGMPSLGSNNYYGVLSQPGATVYLRNCAIDISEAAPDGRIKVAVYAGGGEIQIRSLDDSVGLSIVDDGEGTTSRILYGSQGGSISMVADINLNVSVNVAVLSLLGVSIFSVTTGSGIAPKFTGNATGKRYDVRENSIAATGGRGTEFFPGTIAGTTSTGGQYT